MANENTSIGSNIATFILSLFIGLGVFTDASFIWMLGIGFVLSLVSTIVINHYVDKSTKEVQTAKHNSALDIVDIQIKNHIETLARKRQKLIRIGDYGEEITDSWRKELIKFLKLTTTNETYNLLGLKNSEAIRILADYADGIIEEFQKDLLPIISYESIDNLDGVDYEIFCEGILIEHGWQVQRTPQSGDHGVDLIAEKLGRKVAIQCKRLSSPVGNTAVQEVYSGMKFYDATEAIVVTNSEYTSNAITLAKKLSVLLKHHSELSIL